MERLTLDTGGAASEIVIASGLLDRADELLADTTRNGRMVVITDAHVADAQLPRMRAAMAREGIAIDAITLPAGEATKDWGNLQALCDALADRRVRRNESVFALGGGVVGDIAGLAAALHLRGCGFVQIPTSLVAQVDSSVGGKVAVDTSAGKNMVGTFYHPDLVLIDPTCLETLPPRELRAGYAEVVKYGLLGDAVFFDWCETNATMLLAYDAETLSDAITQSVAAKARIVALDATDVAGPRALLNLGHSFAHAFETYAGYDGVLLHGEAVAAGMTLAFRFSAERGHCPLADADRVKAHIESTGLPVDIPAVVQDASSSQLVDLMIADKKNADARLTLVLANGIGDAFTQPGIDPADVVAFLDRVRA